MTLDPQKLKAAVHAIVADGLAKGGAIGKVKLRKSLYFADMLHFIGRASP